MTKWIEEVRNICGSGVPVLLIGCKKDLRDSYTGEGKDTKFVSTAQVGNPLQQPKSD